MFCISTLAAMSPIIVQSGQAIFLCSFTISAAENGAAGKNVFLLGNQTCGAGSAGKIKGCDIGYALAIRSCEGANSVETCTVTAL